MSTETTTDEADEFDTQAIRELTGDIGFEQVTERDHVSNIEATRFPEVGSRVGSPQETAGARIDRVEVRREERWERGWSDDAT